MAFETVFKHVTEAGDPDGYYAQGIGPGEMILDETALPKAQEFALQRNQYSHLAVKAMLNSGIGGLLHYGGDGPREIHNSETDWVRTTSSWS